MQEEKHRSVGGPAKFFIISLSHTSLSNYYQTNFSLMQHHKYSLNEIDSLIPWEKEVYVSMLVDHIKEQEAKQERVR